jgi:hypothetical protein
MEISKLKLELYDLAAIILPGIVFMCELGLLIFGSDSVVNVCTNLKGTQLAILLIFGFGFGNLIQEAGHRLITGIRGERFLKSARDKFWVTPDSELVKTKIVSERKSAIQNVDIAFDYCLGRLSGNFVKRDAFLAVSDFARSIWVLSFMAVFPLGRTVLYAYGWEARCRVGLEGLVLLAICGWLSWVRMIRFRALSETPVFGAYLARKDFGDAGASPKDVDSEPS